MFSGISLRASRRTMRGTRILPIPCPVKSTLMVSRERESVTGSTRTSPVARIGPSVPRTPQVLGGSMRVSSEVTGRLAPPMRRVVTHFVPTGGIWVLSAGLSMCPSSTPFCHWLNRDGSVAQAKTRAAGRSISAGVTIGGMVAAILQQRGVAVQVKRPALGPVYAVGNCLPSGAVPVDMAVLQFDPGAGRRLGVEPDLDLAGLGVVGLDGPLRADVPAEYHPVWRVESQDARPAALAAVGCPVHDAAADPGFEHRLGDGRAEQVVLGRLEVAEPVGEHREGALNRRVHHDLLADYRWPCLRPRSSSLGASMPSAYPPSARCQ